MKYPCGQLECECYLGSSDAFIDCSNRNLTKIPIFNREEVFQMNLMTLDKNHLRKLTRGAFNQSIFVSLMVIYLRDNPNLDCQSVSDNIPTGINVIANCGFTRDTRSPPASYFSGALSFTVATGQSYAWQSSTSTSTTIYEDMYSSTTTGSIGGKLARMYTLLFTLLGLLAMALVICLTVGICIKLKWRRSRLSSTISTFELFPYSSSEQDLQETCV